MSILVHKQTQYVEICYPEGPPMAHRETFEPQHPENPFIIEKRRSVSE